MYTVGQFGLFKCIFLFISLKGIGCQENCSEETCSQFNCRSSMDGKCYLCNEDMLNIPSDERQTCLVIGTVQDVRACEGSTAVLQCTGGQTITIIWANYGRLTDYSVCPYHRPVNKDFQCKASRSLTVVKSRCEGKPSCRVPASNSLFGDPCGNTYKYLDIQYNCGQCGGNTSYCGNGGSCYASVDGVFCSCVEPFIGQQCQDVEQGPELLTMQDSSPLFGPMAGGTIISISATTTLNMGDVTQVFIGELTCNIINHTLSTEAGRNRTTITCTTPALGADLPDPVELPIALEFEHGEKSNTGLRFRYNPNPKISKIEPLETIVSGGNALTVSGTSLAAASKPLMRIVTLFYNSTDNTTTTLSSSASICSIVSNSQITCPVPHLNLPDTLLAKANSTSSSRKRRDTESERNEKDNTEQSQADNEQKTNNHYQKHRDGRAYIIHHDRSWDNKIRREKRQTTGRSQVTDVVRIEEDEGFIAFYISLLFDGDRTYNNVSTVLPGSGQVTAYFDLQVVTWNQALAFRPNWPHNDEYIDIGGHGILNGIQQEDIIVALGLGQCPIVNVFDNKIICRPPNSPDALKDERGTIDVRVVVGIGNYKAKIGEIYYPMNYQLILIGVALFIGILLIFILLIYCVRKYVRKKRTKCSDKLTSPTSKASDIPLNSHDKTSTSDKYLIRTSPEPDYISPLDIM